MASNRKRIKYRAQVRLDRKIGYIALKKAISEHFSESMRMAFDEFTKRMDSGQFMEKLAAPLHIWRLPFYLW